MKKPKAKLEQLKQQLNPKRRDLKILWHANSPHANSGYSVFTRDLLFRLLKDGWNVAVSGYGAGVDSYPVYMNGEDLIDNRFKGLKLKVYPKTPDDQQGGGLGLVDHSINFQSNVTFSMQDVWTLSPQMLQRMKTWIPYMPIDKYPVPQNVLVNLQFAYKIITFSQFGHDALAEKGFTSNLIVEGIDTEIFKPMSKQEMRDKFKIPQDIFLFGMIGANKENPPRKGYQEAIEAFALFQKNHPDSGMFFHTQQIQPTGFPIQALTHELKLKNCYFMDGYTQSFNARSHDIAQEINCFDVLLHPSRTEGFGLLPIEAMACGIPVIVNNTTASPEAIIVGKTGEICKTNKRWFTPDATWIYDADIPDLHECMERLYKQLKEPNTIAQNCRDHVLEKYNIDKLFIEQWVPLFEDLQNEILPLTPTPQPSIIQSAPI